MQLWEQQRLGAEFPKSVPICPTTGQKGTVPFLGNNSPKALALVFNSWCAKSPSSVVIKGERCRDAPLGTSKIQSLVSKKYPDLPRVTVPALTAHWSGFMGR